MTIGDPMNLEQHTALVLYCMDAVDAAQRVVDERHAEKDFRGDPPPTLTKDQRAYIVHKTLSKALEMQPTRTSP